jgi:predicted transcriptional regulator
MNELKMTSADDASRAILVSFASKWLDTLVRNEVAVVFRKRGPRHISPNWMYIYLAAPKSAVVGRARIHSLDWLPCEEAFALAADGKIDPDELRRYAVGYDSLAVFRIGQLEIAHPKLTFAELSSQFGFSPPQSFFVLSESGQRHLDKLAGFETIQQKPTRRK